MDVFIPKKDYEVIVLSSDSESEDKTDIYYASTTTENSNTAKQNELPGDMVEATAVVEDAGVQYGPPWRINVVGSSLYGGSNQTHLMGRNETPHTGAAITHSSPSLSQTTLGQPTVNFDSTSRISTMELVAMQNKCNDYGNLVLKNQGLEKQVEDAQREIWMKETDLRKAAEENLKLKKKVSVSEKVMGKQQSKLEILGYTIENLRMERDSLREKLERVNNGVGKAFATFQDIIKDLSTVGGDLPNENDGLNSGIAGVESESQPDPLAYDNFSIETGTITDEELSDPSQSENANQHHLTSVLNHGVDTIKPGLFCKCGNEYPSKSSLRQHVNYYTTERKFSCRVCMIRFFSNGSLKQHYLRKHNMISVDMMGRFGCRKCGETFPSKLQLYRHRKLKHNNQRWVYGSSDSYGRRGIASNSYSLNQKPCLSPTINNQPNNEYGQQITTDEMLTDEPGNTPTTSSLMGQRPLTRRRRAPIRFNSEFSSSAGAKPPSKSNKVKNGSCRRNYWNNNNLHGSVMQNVSSSSNISITGQGFSCQNHGIDYTKEGFACLCGNYFTTRHGMLRHIQLKLGIGLFKCDYCSSSFPRHDYLKKHVWSTHGVPYVFGKWGCSICAKKFRSLQELRNHRRKQNHFSGDN